ncbi:MAG: SPOR domain-containing protein [Pusillimonas sp.]
MGFFSKGSDSDESRRTSARPNEAQANELRVRARRRLIGALALVVAAVIVVPMLIDNEPPPGSPVSPIVVPAIPALPDQNRVDLAAVNTGNITIEQLPDPEGPVDLPPEVEPPVVASQPESTAPSALAPVQARPEPAPKPKPEPAPAAAASGRTDDGAVALALLEGRKPETAEKPAATPAKPGNFVLQIAAYTTEQDATARRNKLVDAGVTNAFVQSATANGKTAWRLRVGPFPTREAAQAAQTRLRALGYDNGFISTK